MPGADRRRVEEEGDWLRLVTKALAGKPVRRAGPVQLASTIDIVRVALACDHRTAFRQDIPPEAMLVQLLAFAGQDAATRDILLGILADPPVNRQMAVAEYIGDPLLIGALVTLLQTRLRIKIKSDGVKRSYEVQVDKAAADASIISAVLARFNGPAS